MALPGVADILCGLTYYLAGILIGVRDARWFGSRLLPVGLALVCSLFVVLLAAFWQAVVAIIVVDGILWVAAGGSFVSSGIFASMSGWSKAALGLAVLVGIVLVGYVTMAILAAAVSSTHHESRSYMFTKSGDVIVELRHGRHMETVSHVDLQGTAVEEVELWSGAYLATGDRMTMRSGFDHYRSHHRFYMSLLPNRQDLIWHFAMPDGLLLAYDMTSKMLVGGIGPAGTLDDAELPARRFKTHPTWSHSNLGMLICFPDVVYKFIASERKLVEMFRAPEQERIISAGWVTRVTREVSQVAALAVRTNQGVWILDAERGIHSFVPLKKRDRANFSYTRVALFAEPDRFFAIDSDRPVLSPGELVEVAADGTELARRELPAFPVPHREPTLFMNLMGLVVPIGGYFVFGAIAAVSSPEAAEQFLTHWEEATAFYAALILSAAISSIVAYRVARIFAFTSAQRRAWTVLGVRLGPAGLLLQWSLVEWPAREPCHACGRSRVVNRPNCEHCLAPFPAPALDGTEVFEAAAVRTA